MKKQTVFFVIFSLLMVVNLAATPTDSTESKIQLRTYLADENVPLNREVVYHVELSWPGQLDRYHILEAGEPVLTNLKLRGSGSANNFSLDAQGNPISKKTITYYFVPRSIGMAYVDGVIIKYEDKLSGLKESLMSQRLGVKIIEAVPEAGNKPEMSTIILFLLAALFLLVVAYFIKRYYGIRKKQKEMLAQKPPTLEDSYLLRLQEEIKVNNKDVSARFVGLSRMLQDYFKEKFNLRLSADFEKIKEELYKRNLNETELNKIKAFYEQAELNKFAGEEISENDYHLFYDTVELLLGKLNSEGKDANELEER